MGARFFVPFLWKPDYQPSWHLGVQPIRDKSIPFSPHGSATSMSSRRSTSDGIECLSFPPFGSFGLALAGDWGHPLAFRPFPDDLGDCRLAVAGVPDAL